MRYFMLEHPPTLVMAKGVEIARTVNIKVRNFRLHGLVSEFQNLKRCKSSADVWRRS